MKILILIDEGDAKRPAWAADRAGASGRSTSGFLRTREIADLLDVTLRTVRDLARRGKLPQPTREGGEFVFRRDDARRAVAALLKKRAARARLRLPTERPVPRWGGRAAVLEPALTTRDVALKLGVGPETVRAMLWRGEIARAWRTGRQLFFDPDEIRFLRAVRNREREAARARRTLRLPRRGA